MDRSNSGMRSLLRRSGNPISLLFVALFISAGALHGQHDHGGPEVGAAAAGAAAAEVPLMTSVLGPYSRPITTSSPLAQAYFDQGMQMVYAFTYSVAIQSFREAQRQDPNCAMCYWGEALARGPFLNGGLTSGNAGPAYETAMKAAELVSEDATPAERGLIQAMSVRYAEQHDPAARASLDSLYSRVMADVYRAHGDDLDVGTLYAESVMLLDTARGDYRLDSPFVQSFHTVLEDVLARDLTHPGACHLYIHGTEATEEPERAEACADHLGSAIPGSSHINHMPSHTYNRIGRWGSAVRSNIEAWHSDQRAEYGEGVSYAATHNLHMLLFAASMDGQGAVAALASGEYAKEVHEGVYLHAPVLLRFGRIAEILALTGTPEQPFSRGMWDFARGYAHLRSGAPDSAAFYLDRVNRAASDIPETVRVRGRHLASDLVAIGGHILQGELFREEGRLDEAIAAFERADAIHAALAYDEPEPLPFSPAHWLGNALLEADRAADAELVYRESLVQHPHNGWSLFGLEQALRAQGKAAEADGVRQAFNRAWDRADTLIRSSRF